MMVDVRPLRLLQLLQSSLTLKWNQIATGRENLRVDPTGKKTPNVKHWDPRRVPDPTPAIGLHRDSKVSHEGPQASASPGRSG